MSKKYCCGNCFSDSALTLNIIPTLVNNYSCQGKCNYCASEEVDVIEPYCLNPWFSNLLDCYTQDSKGKTLVTLLSEDWCFFNDSVKDKARDELLADIINDKEIVSRTFSPIDTPFSGIPQSWDNLRKEIMHSNRWFINNPINLDSLKVLLEHLLVSNASKDIPDKWYRARLFSEEPFTIKEMGAPPKKLATSGRANPVGIPYLYLGSTQETAVAEVRPHPGEKACVATFKISPINMVDLRNPRKSASPFFLENSEQIIELRAGLPLLERLGKELSKPVQPSSAPFEYIPSQYFCEFIKDCGYKGVLYQSSVSDGINLVIFFPDSVHPENIINCHVDRVTVDISAPASF